MIKNDKQIAIIGMACRLPGSIKTPENYWSVLSQGQDVVTEISDDRWGTEFYSHGNKKEPGKSYTFAAGVLDAVDQFDAAFFGISPREAEQMDPQQRLLLELAWEAIEESRISIDTLKGTDCAVYMGIASNDYAHRRTDDLASLDAYTMTGNTASVASNRISYNFNLQGPSVSVDTACSSSLVAVHQACQSIWTGEASTALCGGINMLLHPFPFIGFSKASMLSPDGRCKAFDNDGNGYVRAEGAGIFLLKPLAQAEADGDHIHAVIINSGVNCDGSTSGITVPSMETQSALLDKIYSDAGVAASDLSYLEAHGTGTAVGDPLEANSLGQSIGVHRKPENPLLIGSAKTNLGHLETASGMAGLLKAVLTLKNRAIPASLHFNKPNENIDFTALNLRVVTELTPLPEQEKPHLVGINSFGFGGANAHVLIEEYKPQTIDQASPDTISNLTPPLILSARAPEALSNVAEQYLAHLKLNTNNYYATAYSAFKYRSMHTHTMAVYGENPDQLIEQLEQYTTNGTAKKVITNNYSSDTKLAFVFTGNGCQWQGMGQALYQSNTSFKAIFDKVSVLLNELSADYSLEEELLRAKDTSQLDLTEIAQPLLFAIQVGIVEFFSDNGISADAVIGHSVGEVAAAWTAGALSLEQAVRVIHFRSQAQGLTKGTGRMAAVGLGNIALAGLLQTLDLNESIEIAGDNSPNNSTISGKLEDLLTLQTAVEAQGSFYRVLDLDYAFHSTAMDEIESNILTSLSELTPEPTKLPYISTVTGKELSGEKLTANYWWDNIRQPVQFNQGITQLAEQGFDTFIEIGAHPILRAYVSDCLTNAGKKGTVIGSLKRKHDSEEHLYQNTLKLILSGVTLDSTKLFPVTVPSVALPPYPWQRQRYWYPLTSEGYDLVNRKREHPLLGYRLKDSDIIWENNLDTTELPYLADHVVDDAIVLPAAAFIEMAIAASALWCKSETHHIEMVEIPVPILLEEGTAKKVRFHLDPSDGSFRVTSRDRLSKDEWTQNATGRLLKHSFKKPKVVSLNNDLLSDSNRILGEEHYTLAETVGLKYGPNFQAVTSVNANTLSALAELTLPEALESDLESYHLHPSLLDSGFQVLVDICRSAILSGINEALIPIQVGSLHLLKSHAGSIKQVLIEVVRRSPRSLVANFYLLDGNSETVVILEKCRFRQIQFKSALPKKINQYQYKTKLLPHQKHPVATPSVDVDSLVKSTQLALDKSDLATLRNKHFNEYSLLIDMMASSYAFDAINNVTNKGSISLSEAKETLDDALHPLFNRLLAILEENDLVAINGDYANLQAEELAEANDIWQYIYQAAPTYLPELLVLSQCGEQLTEVLTGELTGQAVLSPEKSSLLEQLFEGAPSYAPFNQALLTSVESLLEQFDSQQLCRVLVISDYPDQLTHNLLSLLNNQAFELTVAYADESKLGSLTRLFETSDSAQTMVLNINDIDIETAPQDIDLIISSHVLHKLDNRSAGLKKVSTLLNTNGQLFALERAPDRFTDLTFGTSPEWWGTDHSRLMTASDWSQQLSDSNFIEATSLEDSFSDNQQGVFLLFATKGEQQEPEFVEEVSATQEHWLVINPVEMFDAKNSIALPSSVNIKASHAKHGSGFEEISSTDFICNMESVADYSQLLSCNNYDRVIYLATACKDDLLTPMHRIHPLLGVLESLEDIPQLVIVTSGAATAISVKAEPMFEPKSSTMWGFGRVIMNEYPDLRCRLIDTGRHVLSEPELNFAQEVLNDDGNDEVMLSAKGRHVLRMQQTDFSEAHTKESTLPASLDFKVPGSFKNLYWRAQSESRLGEDQIEIRPIASGLNFRDIMYAMGLLSDEAVENGFAGPTLGMETAGIVTKIGASVTEFAIGDEVLGFAPACFSNRVITGTTATAHKPKDWSFEEAATVPTTFFTVYYAFVHLAQLQEGEKVLIHGASGGVGIAAVQLALHLGAEVFAAAGTPEKRAFVKNIGAHHVLDSRSLSFENDIFEITEGEGIDVVLNSVYGEAVNRNLSILKPFGRFLELGKRDFYENSRIGLRPFRNNITYFGIDADQLLTEKASLAKRLFKDLMVLFEEKEIHPLPHRVFDANRIQDAFSYMQQSRQIGKVILRLPESLPVETRLTTQTLALDESATYIVTGGLSGFGLTTAQWLASKGAKHLTLLGRKGPVTEESLEAITKFEAAGITVYSPACDVTNESQLKAVFTNLTTNEIRVGGVVHAATVFDDALIRNMTTEQLDNVIGAKAAGAWNLHEQTKDLQLDFFVLYSSATTLFGNPGQANYVAANYMLENLALYRRQLGLTACYAAWGAISDVGFLARNKDTQDSLVSRFGGEALISKEALAELEKLILDPEQPGNAYINFDWKAIKRTMPSAKSPKFTQQNNWLDRHTSNDDGDDFFTHIEGMSEEEVQALIATMLTREISQILRLPMDKINPASPIYDLGMDSLMGMELLLAIEERFKTKLPLMSLTEGGSINKISEKIYSKINDAAKPEVDETMVNLASKHGTAISQDDLANITRTPDSDE
ncbi:type I polyketide synthase [Leucothrix arctica]|uniref:Uncharacterized protein n=1 Tax=Leucothrix arctica TaxID=1481894 RepID=A0A317CFC2_9GAMM|nr:type I polyketide synthase [Leucothrix arctica]PWQ95010.1 hypothetical protein DKT75_13835 [Leucothrix arctica]